MAGIVKRRLGDMLVESGKITMLQLQDSLREQKITGKKLGEVLIDDEVVTSEDIMEVLEKQLGIERVNLNMVYFDTKAVKLVSESLCLKHELIPFGFDGNKIKVAMWDPLNIFAIDDVAISSGFEVETYLSTKVEIKKHIEMQYSGQQVLKAAEELSKEKNIEAKDIQNVEEELDDIKNAPVVKMVDYLIRNAVESRASDIHIEPYEKYIRIRYRIDGQLQEVSTLAIDSLAALIARIKILANLNIAEKRIPQDGRIIINIGDKNIDVRVSVLPTITGEKVVMRILDRTSYQIDKSVLGLDNEELEKLETITKSPYGIILVTGPTGSGKSTTLYTILNELNSGDKNIITVEDPVEYMLEGVNQVNVNAKAGLTFAAGLRSILRQDPDIIMIGEIRDGETAEIATKAALTGHLVLSTLHTNDAPSTIVRLIDMGIEPFLVASSVTGVIAQRLVRRLCPKCKTPYQLSESEKEVLGVNSQESVDGYRANGCAYCNGTGYMGRVGVYEIMEVSKKHRESITKGGNGDELRKISIENGMKTIAMSCRNLVLSGVTTLDEYIKIAFFKE